MIAKEAVEEAQAELGRAMQKHTTPMRSLHEGYAILLEEVDELWQIVKLHPTSLPFATRRARSPPWRCASCVISHERSQRLVLRPRGHRAHWHEHRYAPHRLRSLMNSCQKGKRGEREFAAFLRERGFEARRGQQFSGGDESPDVIHSVPGVHFEVKRTEALSLYKALGQAADDCKRVLKIPVVAHRRNKCDWVGYPPDGRLPQHD